MGGGNSPLLLRREMKDFVIYFSSYGTTEDETVISLEALRQYRHYDYDVVYLKGDALIGRSRSRAATQFLKANNAPYMFFIDTDIVFTPEDIDKLYTAMQQGIDVIAGAYSVASGEFLAVKANHPVTFDGSIAEMQYVSTGFMGISRRALKQVRDGLDLPILHAGEAFECFPFFESGRLVEQGIYISEDWDWNSKCQKVGIPVYLHTGVLVGHVKKRTIPAAEALQNMYKKEQPKLTDDRIVQDLAEFDGVSVDEARLRMALGLQDSIAEAENNPDFYVNGKKLIYDLAAFNANGWYLENRLRPLRDTVDSCLLDFGCGIGTMAFEMAARRNEVYAYDINKRCLEFARFRAEKFGYVKLHFIDSLDIDLSKVKVIYAIDVFEHLPDAYPVLRDLHDRVKKGTKLLQVSPWDHKHPLHVGTRENYRESLEKAGFLDFDGHWAVRV